MVIKAQLCNCDLCPCAVLTEPCTCQPLTCHTACHKANGSYSICVLAESSWSVPRSLWHHWSVRVTAHHTSPLYLLPIHSSQTLLPLFCLLATGCTVWAQHLYNFFYPVRPSALLTSSAWREGREGHSKRCTVISLSFSQGKILCKSFWAQGHNAVLHRVTGESEWADCSVPADTLALFDVDDASWPLSLPGVAVCLMTVKVNCFGSCVTLWAHLGFKSFFPKQDIACIDEMLSQEHEDAIFSIKSEHLCVYEGNRASFRWMEVKLWGWALSSGFCQISIDARLFSMSLWSSWEITACECVLKCR